MAAATVPDAIGRALGAASLPAAFLARAAGDPDRVALRQFGSERVLTLGEWSARAQAVAGGLESLGVRSGDRVGFATARGLAAACPQIAHVIVVEEDAAVDGELHLAGLERLCAADFDVAASVASLDRDGICTLVYTSGTTGAPKGVQVRHGAMLDCLDSVRTRFPAGEDDRAISYLPMAHIAERIFGHYAAFVYGYEVTSLANPLEMSAALRAVRPTRYFGVPRFYEKLPAGLHRYVAEAPDGTSLQEAWDARVARVRAEQSGQPVPSGDDAAHRETLRPLAELTGLDQVRFLVVGGAPSTLAVLEEVTALGLPIAEFYGSSELILASGGTAAAALGLRELDFAALSRQHAIHEAITAAVERGNERLSRVEQIKRFHVLDHDWLPGSEELTPTAKLKRREIATKYAAEIEARNISDPADRSPRSPDDLFNHINKLPATWTPPQA